MRTLISIRKCVWLISLILVIVKNCESQFTCPTIVGEEMSDMPEFYSTNVRINYLKQQQTVEIRQVVNHKDNKMAFEIWAGKRHVKYIQFLTKLLKITFNSDGAPTCTVKDTPKMTEFLNAEDAGPNKILEKLGQLFQDPSVLSKFYVAGTTVENGVYLKKWEGCFNDPKMNVSRTFTETSWQQAHISALHKGKYIVSAEAQIRDDYMTALFSNFDPRMPDDTEFQPPENVYCPGFREENGDKKPPELTNYFSYDSEIIVYESDLGIAPIVSRRRVFYDYSTGIARTDLYDALAEDQDLFSKVTAQDKSIIHDFYSGMQYVSDPATGKCNVDDFKATIGPVFIRESGAGKMLIGLQFFSLNVSKLSYNGQYPTRGVMADVFNAVVENPKGKSIARYIYTWYFSTDRTQVVEKENVEKNALLRMVVRPEAADGKEGMVVVNFFNFVKEQPDITVFDFTSCYDDSVSKTFVFTFPVNDALRGSEKLLKSLLHDAIRITAGVSKQRISVTEVDFTKKYMYAEFKILASPDVLMKKTPSTKEISLDDALKKLKESVSSDQFNVTVAANDKMILLKPEPNGLNEFAGDRRVEAKSDTYKEGSVIAVTIGMLFLGIVLGGVTINLIISRKYGVSLFQTKKTTKDPFESALESSM